ncbi:hypothetical protein PHISP_06537 [Aspergillus sp. HF37]|nr:hypothetical protein PHISP_06537 [Aspergillus sp. HF37]
MHLPSAVLLISLPALGVSLAVPKQLNDNIMRRSPQYSVVNVDGESNPPPSPESSMIESSSPSSATPTFLNTPTSTLTPIVTPCASKTPASSMPASSSFAVSSSIAVSSSVPISSSAPYPSSSASSVPIAEDGFGGEFNAPYDNGFVLPSASAYGGGGSAMRFSDLRARDLTG